MKIERSHPEKVGGQWRPLMPWLLLLFAGSLALGLYFIIRPFFWDAPYYKVGWRQNAYSFSRLVLLLFVPYVLALWAWRKGKRAPLWFLLGGAVILHLVVMFAPFPQSQDFYQYLFYGRLQAAHAANPYLVHPIQFFSDPWYPWIRWLDQTSVYGPVWMLTSFAVAKAAGANLPLAVVLLKLVILALDLATMGMILVATRDRPDGRGAQGFGILAYAWNPLILISVPLAGTADTVLGAAFLGAYLARRRGREWVATILLTIAMLVKVYAAVGLLLHLALVFRERGAKEGAKHAGAVLGLAALAFAPYWAGPATFGGLVSAAGLTNQSLVGGMERLLLVPVLRLFGIHPAGPVAEDLVRIIAVGLLLSAAVWAIRRVRAERDLWPTVVALLAAYMLLTPWFLYWYIVAPIVLVSVLPPNRLTWPVLTFSGAALFTTFPTTYGALLVQTAGRYAPPLLVYGVRPKERRRAASGAEQAVIRLPATAATTRQAAAAE